MINKEKSRIFTSVTGLALMGKIAWNEMNIFPYVTIIKSSINRENLQKSQNKIFPINGTQLYIFITKKPDCFTK